MSVLVAKSSSEFRRPPTVQRNKGGLAKYLGNAMSSSPSRGTTTNDWEARTSPSATAKKPPLVIAPRINSKIDKKLPKPLPSLPISNDVLKNLPKISSLRYRYSDFELAARLRTNADFTSSFAIRRTHWKWKVWITLS